MTDNKKTSVFGLYPSVQRAERAVDELVASGFSNGAATTMSSWRTKFPFFERPGPFRGRFRIFVRQRLEKLDEVRNLSG